MPFIRRRKHATLLDDDGSSSVRQVRVQPGKLGIMIECESTDGHGAILHEIRAPSQVDGHVAVGALLYKVAGKSVVDSSLEYIMRRIQSRTRPYVIEFIELSA